MTTTQERIFVIADQLVASGQRPTLAAVRKALGGGSYTTLQQAMSEWKAAQQENPQATKAEAPPPSVTERMSEAAMAVWQIAQEVANARLATERHELEQTRVTLETERSEAAELADRLAQEVDSLQAKLDTLEKTLSEERAAAAQAANAAAAQKAALEATIAQMQKQLEDQQKQTEGFSKTLLSQIESLFAQQKKSAD